MDTNAHLCQVNLTTCYIRRLKFSLSTTAYIKQRHRQTQTYCETYSDSNSQPDLPYSTSAMASLSVELTAPNGINYSQPTGLFINNEFVESLGGQRLTSIDPA